MAVALRTDRLLIGHLAAGVLAGKLAADLVFYALAIAGYELHKAVVARRNRPAVPAADSGRRLRRRATKPPRSLAGADSTVV
jgi:hypothetical protein